MRALIRLNQGILRMPIGWQLWLMLLVAVNLVVPLFYLGSVEAQVVLAVFGVNMVLMTWLTHLTGFTRLLGLGHVLWIPLLYFLGTRLAQIPADDGFGVWIRALIAINAVSLVIDAVDVGRYIAGERAETIEDL